MADRERHGDRHRHGVVGTEVDQERLHVARTHERQRHADLSRGRSSTFAKDNQTMGASGAEGHADAVRSFAARR